MCFGPKLGHRTCAICCTPYDFPPLAFMIDKPWVTGITEHQQPLYQPIKDCTYWPVLGSFNNWNILQLSHNATTS